MRAATLGVQAGWQNGLPRALHAEEPRVVPGADQEQSLGQPRISCRPLPNRASVPPQPLSSAAACSLWR